MASTVKLWNAFFGAGGKFKSWMFTHSRSTNKKWAVLGGFFTFHLFSVYRVKMLVIKIIEKVLFYPENRQNDLKQQRP